MFPAIRNQAKLAAVVAALLAFTPFASGDAWAQAKNVQPITCTLDMQGNLDVDFEVKGVGNDDLCVVANTIFTARCACQTNPGTCPSAQNKKESLFPASASDVVEPKNGRIRGSLELTAPDDEDCAAVLGQGGGPSCPAGQTPILAELVVPGATVEIFDQFTVDDTGVCVGVGDPIFSGTCEPESTTFTFDADCAEGF